MNARRMALGVLASAGLALGGCTVRAPGAAEKAIMTWTKQSITVGGKKDANPLPENAESIRAGEVAFAHYCFTCHGLDGQATGVPFADKMLPPVPSLSSPAVQKYTDGQLRSVIANGISPSGMPASRDILSDEEIWSIVVYLRHLPPKGSLGEPSAFSDEEIERLKAKK